MSKRTYLIVVATLTAIILTISNGSLFGKSRVKKPAESEFGTGPRTSAHGMYVVTLEDADALQPRKMYTLRALVTNGQTGQSVTDAAIAIDGGMPQHRHGLPTRPRVTQNLGDGRYEIGGVRFNMGGWWEFKLIIIGPAGTDTVTFNLAL